MQLLWHNCLLCTELRGPISNWMDQSSDFSELHAKRGDRKRWYVMARITSSEPTIQNDGWVDCKLQQGDPIVEPAGDLA